MTSPESYSLPLTLPLDDGARPPINLKAKNSLARTLTPEYMGLRPENYIDITEDMVNAAAPARLRTGLIREARTEGALEIRCEANEAARLTSRFAYVGVLPQEYLLLAGNLRTAGNRSLGRTAVKRSMGGRALSDEDKAAAERASAYTIENIAGKVEKYLKNDIASSLHRIHRFQEAVGVNRKTGEFNPRGKGLSHFGNEANMRMELTALQQQTFGSMLTVIGKRRGWSEDQAQLAKRALDVRFFLVADKRQRAVNFLGMLNLAEDWTNHKQAAAKTRLAEAEKILRERQTEA